MEIHEALFSVGLLIVVAKLLEGVFKRLGLNSIIAYATTGVILGPLTGLVEADTEIAIVLGIGIFVFFFLIGLDELDITGLLAAVRGRLLFAAVLSVAISMLVSLSVTTDFLFDLQLGLEFTQAFGLAGVLSLSSLGVVAKVLIDEGRLKEPVGVQIFTAVIIAELIALFIVGFAISEHFYAGGHTHTLNPLDMGVVVGQIAGFTVVTWFFSTKILPRIIVLLHHFLQVPQLSFGLLLGGLFLVVVGAEEVGLHGSLGALLFGAALSMLPYQVRRDIMPGMRGAAEGFFVPLVFRVGGPAPEPRVPGAAPGNHRCPGPRSPGRQVRGSICQRFRDPARRSTRDRRGPDGEGSRGDRSPGSCCSRRAPSTRACSPCSCWSCSDTSCSRQWASATRSGDSGTPTWSRPTAGPRLCSTGSRWRESRSTTSLDRSRSHPEPSLTVRAFAERWLLPEQHDYVVVDHGKLVGIVSLSMLRYLPRDQWEHTPLRRVVRQESPRAYSDELVEDALQRMTENALTYSPWPTGRQASSSGRSPATRSWR